MLQCILSVLLLLFLIFFLFFYTPGSKSFRGLKTKVKNVAGMAIGPGNWCRMSRAKAQSWFFAYLRNIWLMC